MGDVKSFKYADALTRRNRGILSGENRLPNRIEEYVNARTSSDIRKTLTELLNSITTPSDVERRRIDVAMWEGQLGFVAALINKHGVEEQIRIHMDRPMAEWLAIYCKDEREEWLAADMSGSSPFLLPPL
ncbi:hypothetical protein HK097_002532 [Rhizophlyctis rosea]|uniref:Uncharacterized protein n=1 Tax=Rhizophlyctis rosea TaxID=64517 RepID=A0AAD5SH41_9FUNG|nr:hypothetical protein HK097_002532 [Rhizophlyctis rosea]